MSHRNPEIALACEAKQFALLLQWSSDRRRFRDVGFLQLSLPQVFFAFRLRGLVRCGGGMVNRSNVVLTDENYLRSLHCPGVVFWNPVVHGATGCGLSRWEGHGVEKAFSAARRVFVFWPRCNLSERLGFHRYTHEIDCGSLRRRHATWASARRARRCGQQGWGPLLSLDLWLRFLGNGQFRSEQEWTNIFGGPTGRLTAERYQKSLFAP